MREPDGRSRRCFLKASSMLGLGAAFMPPTIGEAFADSRIAGKEDTMTRTSATQATDKTTIRPFPRSAAAEQALVPLDGHR